MEPFQKKGMEEKGVAHIFAAFGYSMAGLKVLMREEAARLEVVFFAAALIAFFVSGALAHQYLVLLALFAALLATEAINTAVELIIDKTSPEISEYAKMSKDLGSFAVMCALCIFGGYIAWVVLTGWFGQGG